MSEKYHYLVELFDNKNLVMEYWKKIIY
jgi:hypothetical protein